jgi:DNA invertase Pin-like site-specific DNA recombinase
VLIGYARVSSADQNPDHQIDALHRAGVEEQNIYLDHASGAKASRPKLDEILRMLRDGDTLKITRLDRLGRSVLHLVTLGAALRQRGVGLHVIEQASTPQPPKAARCSACSPSSPSSSAS